MPTRTAIPPSSAWQPSAPARSAWRAVRRDPPRRHDLRRQRRRRRRRRRRDPRRPHRGRRRRRRARATTEIDAHGHGRRAGLHQHAELGDRVADRRRPRAERHPAGRHARGLRRGRVDGPAQRRDEEGDASSSRATSSTTSTGPRSASTSTTSSQRGISPNVASFVGATTVRIHVLGYEDRAPTAEELERMRALVRQAMEEGALGVGSSLIYAPAFYAKTDELIALCKAAARVRRHVHLAHAQRRQPPARGGRRADHDRARGRACRPRSITSRRRAKRTGRRWTQVDRARSRRRAREGLRITADMYTYTAGATGLDAAMPPWVQEGGYDAWVERLQDPAIRARVTREMTHADRRVGEPLPARRLAGAACCSSASRATRSSRSPGKTLAEVARMRGTSPEETAMDLVDRGRHARRHGLLPHVRGQRRRSRSRCRG